MTSWEPVIASKLRESLPDFQPLWISAEGEVRPASAAPEGSKGRIVPFTLAGIGMAYASMLIRQRAAARARMKAEVRQYRSRMADLLAADDAQSPESAEQLKAGLGRGAGQYFQTGVLAKALSRTAGSAHKLPAHRRERIQGAVKAFDHYLASSNPACWVVGDVEAPSGLAELGAQYRVTGSPAETGIELAGGISGEWSTLLMALRISRLEAESAFVEEIHGPRLERFHWSSGEAWEREAAPAVVVLDAVGCEICRAVARRLPVHFLLSRRGLGVAEEDGMLADPAAMTCALGEAFVLESSRVAVTHLLGGLGEMARAMRPAVAVINMTDDPLAALAVDESRAFPHLVYEPAAGDVLSARLRLRQADGIAVSLAEAVALTGECTADFELGVDDAPGAFQAKTAEGQTARVAVSRRVGLWARERASALVRWEEAAGIGNVWADRVRAQFQQEWEQKAAEREQAAFARGLEAGKGAAVHNLVGVLLNGKPVAITARSERAAPKPSAAPAPAPPPSPQPAAAEEAAAEPYIDSFLCTSCNDCMKVNARVFRYNANQQAYLADASAGTFAELVKAAEGCPAQCIHVGTPRAGDSTATGALITKSAKWR